MSGGSLDYAYEKINIAEEELLRSARKSGNHPELRKELAEHIHACFEVLRAIEWSDSGDTAPSDWVPAAEKLLTPSRAGNRQPSSPTPHRATSTRRGPRSCREPGCGYRAGTRVHFCSDRALSSSASMNSMPRRPSSTVGKSRASGSGFAPARRARMVSAALR